MLLLLLISNAKHKIRALLPSTSNIASWHSEHAYIMQLLLTQVTFVSWWIHALNLLAMSLVKDHNDDRPYPLLTNIYLPLKRIHSDMQASGNTHTRGAKTEGRRRRETKRWTNASQAAMHERGKALFSNR